ncbi:MAG: DNA polymerase III subunit gamma/tau [Candidatus Promineifilaceae bacterium]
MSQALYRKWRPARFDEVVGQEHVTRTLQNAVAADRLGHAYLFSGPRGTGKTTIARLVAKAANCLDDDLSRRPCNVCARCRAVNDGRFLDLIEIDAASNTGVDDIRSLRDKINFSPSEGRYKVYIIDEVHMLSTAAFNALLKTLEEPPSHAIFILATTEEHKVPLTIKSRCQPFSFRLFTEQEIAGRLAWMAEREQLVIEPAALEMIAGHGAGSLRDAESLLDQLVSAPGDTITLARTQMVLGTASDEAVRRLVDAWLLGDGRLGLGVIHTALGTGADARQFARQMVTYLRQLLLLKTGGREVVPSTTIENQSEMIRQAQDADRQGLIDALKRFNEAATTPPVSWQPQLPLELAFIDLLPEGKDYSLAEPREQKAAPAVQTGVQETVAVEEEQLPPPEPAKPELAEAKPVEAVAAEPAAPMQQAVTLDQVIQSWPRLRELVGRSDKSLPGLLASGKPLAMEGTTLILGFEFPILKDRFDGQKGANATVARALEQLLDTECRVSTVITGQYQSSPSQVQISDDDIAALADELGGIVQPQE